MQWILCKTRVCLDESVPVVTGSLVLLKADAAWGATRGLASTCRLTPPKTLELTTEERNTLLAGPLSAAMAVMAVDMGIVSCAQEARALGKELSSASCCYASNPLIASPFGSGEKVREAEKAALDRIRTHLGVTA